MNTIDLTPLLNGAIIVGTGILVTFSSIALQAVTKKFNFQLSQAQIDEWDNALFKAVTYAGTTAEAVIKTKGWAAPEVKSMVLDNALTYMVAMFPRALKNQGLSNDLSDPENVSKIRQALTRTLPNAFTALAASPATPAVEVK